ncbi:MAG: hypothetical protein JJE25_11920 [Bacteroidia bacterium]|nr:hypothetical protein [Bacteroidia bacterium]
MAVLIYFLQFLLTNVFFGVTLALWINRFNKEQTYSLTELLIYSFGAASAVVSILLYYLFLLTPHLNPLVYFLIVVLCFALPAFFIRKDFTLLLNVFRVFKSRLYECRTSGFALLGFTATCLGFFILSQVIILNRPLIEHDILEYGAQAKIFFKERYVQYVGDRFDNESGYYFVGLHGFSFIFLSVWERIMNVVVHSDKDYFFRSITTYYSLLIVLVQFYWFSKKDIVLAFIASILLFTSSGFIMTAMIYHLDTYRIFLMMMSMICMLKAIHYNDRLSILLFGIFTGLSAFVHSIGALLAVMETGIFFLFINGAFLQRLKQTGIVILLLMIFGGIHYVLDTFWGTGWIFKDIKFY